MSNRVALLNVTAAAVILAAGFSAHLAAQSPSNYSIQQVVIDGVTPRPDGLGAFAVLGGLGSFPVIDGDWIVFRSATPGCTPEPDSYYSPCFELWSVNFTNNTFVKLVDGNTHVPQGTGNFSLLGTAGCTHPQARGGGVIFAAQDAAQATGIYYVPTAGGRVKLIANTNTVVPTGGNFVSFGTGCGDTNGWDIYGEAAVFLAKTTLDANNSVFSWTPGAGVTVVADQGCLNDPQITNGAAIAYFAGDCLDSPFRGSYVMSTGLVLVSTGYDFQVTNQYGPSELAGTLFAVLYNTTGYQAIGVTSTLTGGIPGPDGAYTPQFTLWDSNMTLPGISTTPVIIAQGTFTSNKGSAAFQAYADQTNDQNPNIYIASGGTPQLVVSAGDLLGGFPIFQFGQVEHGQIDNGVLVFTTDSDAGFHVFINIAGPATCAPSVSSQVSLQKGGYTPNPATNEYVQHVKIVNTSTTAINGPMLLEVSHISSDAILANQSGYTACAAPLGSPYVAVNLGASNSLAAGASINVQLDFTDPSNQPITHGLAVLSGAGVP